MPLDYKSRTDLLAHLRCSVNGPMVPQVAPPGVFHGHHFIVTLPVAILAGSSREIYQTVRINCRSFFSQAPISVRPSKRCIEVFHTRDQNHVTAGANPFWGSSLATAAVRAVDMSSKLAASANLVKESRNVQTTYRSSGSRP